VLNQVAASHAAGRLDPALSLLVDTRAAMHTPTQRALLPYDTLGGALLETETPVAMCDTALSNVLAAIEAGADEAPEHEDVDPAIRAFPDPLRERAAQAFLGTGWKFVAPGIRKLDLDMGGRSCAEVLRIEPGRGVPRHTHEGAEYTLVITGAFSDGVDRYGPGDVSVADQDTTHRPVAETGEICHALAVTDAPLRFTGALGLLQRALGSLQ